MTKALQIEGLKKVYDNGFEALKGIDLTVEEGDFFALLGPNGAGKSTTISILCSLTNKTAGKVKVFDYDIDTHFPEAKQLIGVVPQEFNFNQFEKVYDILVTQAGYYGIPKKLAEERTEKYLKLLDLWGKREERSRMLSGGMKRRLMIARALVHEPKLLILDEPTAGVDIELRRSMWTFLTRLNRSGVTIILTTHYLEEAESLCRNVAIIDHGEIVENTAVKALLSKLDRQTFVLDARDDVTGDPDLAPFSVRWQDSRTFEVDLKKSENLNELFARLENTGIYIQSMKPKTNRLEELFLSLTAKA